MTRQHFAAIAEAFKSNRPAEHWDTNKRVQWTMDVKAIASVCKRFNSGFKFERFYEACGGLFDNPLPDGPIEAMAQTDTE